MKSTHHYNLENNIFQVKNELSFSQRRGVITLIPKEDANLKDL